MKNHNVVVVYIDGRELYVKGGPFTKDNAQVTMERYWNLASQRGVDDVSSIQVRDEDNKVITELEF